MTLVVQPGLAQPSPAQASLQQSGWVLLCVSPPSVASARPSRYELCIMHPEEEVWKAETLSQLGVYRLIARGSTDQQCKNQRSSNTWFSHLSIYRSHNLSLHIQSIASVVHHTGGTLAKDNSMISQLWTGLFPAAFLESGRFQPTVSTAAERNCRHNSQVEFIDGHICFINPISRSTRSARRHNMCIK